MNKERTSFIGRISSWWRTRPERDEGELGLLCQRVRTMVMDEVQRNPHCRVDELLNALSAIELCGEDEPLSSESHEALETMLKSIGKLIVDETVETPLGVVMVGLSMEDQRRVISHFDEGMSVSPWKAAALQGALVHLLNSSVNREIRVEHESSSAGEHRLTLLEQRWGRDSGFEQHRERELLRGLGLGLMHFAGSRSGVGVLVERVRAGSLIRFRWRDTASASMA